MPNMDIVVSATDKASQVMDNIQNRGGKLGQVLSSSFFKAGSAALVAGAGINKLTNRSMELNTGLRRVEAATGLAEKELRDMTLALSDVTFSNDDVVKGMERLVKSGITVKEDFEEMLPVFDRFSDATGTDIVDSIDNFDRVLSALDIPLQEAGDHLDTMTFLTTQTTVGMKELGMVMRREQAAIRDLGLSVDDTAIAMASLEAEGIRGPRAVMAFQEAIKKADGSVEGFWQNLGVSEKAIKKQSDRLQSAAGITQELADINNSSLTIWDKVKHAMDDLSVRAGTVLERFRDMGPILMGLGPVLQGIAASKVFLAKATAAAGLAMKKFGVAVIAATGPIGWIIAAIAGLTVGLVLLYRNNEKFRNAVIKGWKWIQDNLVNIIKVIVAYIAMPIAILIHLYQVNEKFRDIVIKAWKAASEFILNAGKKIVETVKNIANWFGIGRKTVVEEVTKMHGEAVGEIVEMSVAIETELMNMQINGDTITKDFADKVVANVERMKTMSIQKVEETYKENTKNLEFLRDKAGVLTDEMYRNIMETERKRRDEQIENQEKIAEKVIAHIRQLEKDGVEVTEEMRREIEKSYMEMRDETIGIIAEQEEEVLLILSKLRNETDKITAEMAQKAIKNSMEQRDKVIEAAEEQYDEAIRAINALSDESIEASGKTREQLLLEAKRQQDGVIGFANQMHEGTVEEIFSMNDSLRKDFNLTTGEILTGWQKFVRSMGEATNWLIKNTVGRSVDIMRSLEKDMSKMFGGIDQPIDLGLHDAAKRWERMFDNVKAPEFFSFEDMLKPRERDFTAFQGRYDKMLGGFKDFTKDLEETAVDASKKVAKATGGAVGESIGNSAKSIDESMKIANEAAGAATEMLDEQHGKIEKLLGPHKDKILDIEAKFYNESSTLYDNYTNAKTQLDQNYLKDKESLLEQEKNLIDASVNHYLDSVEKRKASILNESLSGDRDSLFQGAAEDISNMQRYQAAMNVFAGKNVSDALMSQMRLLGPDGIDTIEEVMRMNKEELGIFNQMFAEREQLAQEIAEKETEHLREAMQERNDLITSDAKESLKELEDAWEEAGNNLLFAYTVSLDKLQTETESQMAALKDTFYDAGKSMMENFAEGIEASASIVESAISRVTERVDEYMPHSPAKKGALSRLPDFMAYFVDPAAEALSEMAQLFNREMGISSSGSERMIAQGAHGAMNTMATAKNEYIENNFEVHATIRDERDIEMLAQKLYELQRKRKRSS